MLVVGLKPGGPLKPVDKATYVLADAVAKPQGREAGEAVPRARTKVDGEKRSDCFRGRLT
jgi:hypothetical protein